MITIEEFEAMNDATLNQKIAETRGYEVVDLPFRKGYTLIYSGFALRDGTTEEAAWKGIPEWTSNAGAAIDLFRDNYIEMSHGATGWWYVKVGGVIEHTSPDLCRSLCVLWLELQEMAKAKIVSMS